MNRRQIRRPAAPADRRPATAGAPAGGIGRTEANGGAHAAADADEAEKQALLQQFLGLLGDDPSLDDATRAQIEAELGNALAAIEPSEVPEAPDRAVWMDAARALQAAGAVSDDEANALFRQLDDALASFDRKESKFAMEFSRRMARDGEEAALAWLRQNRHVLLDEGSGDARQVVVPLGVGEPPAMAADAIRSRARRVRGPPRAGR